MLTPDVLLEAEDAEEEILEDVEELGSYSPQSISIDSLPARTDVLNKSGNPNIIPNLPVANTSPTHGLDK